MAKKKLKSDLARAEVAVAYCALLFDQIKFQREVHDRWFRYYLIIVGSPLAGILGLLQIDSVRSSLPELYWAFALLGFAISVVGLLFLLMHIRQRINYYLPFLKMFSIEDDNVKSILAPDRPRNEGVFNPKGSDYYGNWILIFLNSFWMAATGASSWLAVGFLQRSTEAVWLVSIGVFLLANLLQHAIRVQLLAKGELSSRRQWTSNE